MGTDRDFQGGSSGRLQERWDSASLYRATANTRSKRDQCLVDHIWADQALGRLTNYNVVS